MINRDARQTHTDDDRQAFRNYLVQPKKLCGSQGEGSPDGILGSTAALRSDGGPHFTAESLRAGICFRKNWALQNHDLVFACFSAGGGGVLGWEQQPQPARMR